MWLYLSSLLSFITTVSIIIEKYQIKGIPAGMNRAAILSIITRSSHLFGDVQVAQPPRDLLKRI
jgi:hypothetical protein